jgi:hypothetical protein
MDSNVLLTSIITASSILIAVGFPFIMFIVTDHNNRKERLISEIKTHYPKLKSFRKLIYCVFNSGVIKNYERALSQVKSENEKLRIENNDDFHFYQAFQYVSKKYEDDVMNDNDITRVYSYNEICNYQRYSNRIWYDIDCRHDIVKDLHSFEMLLPYELDRIKNAVNEIDKKYSNKKITFGLIASVSGDFEVEVANILADLTKKYEQPLPSILKNLFVVLTISLVCGVIFPLLLLQFSFMQMCYMSIALVAITIICLIGIVFLTGRYVWQKPK